MIKIGFVTTSLTDGNASRGVGFYTKHLLSALKTHSADHDIEILEVSGTSDLSGNAFDLIHYPYFDLFSPSLPLLSSIKTIVTIHDVVPLELPHAYPPGIKGTINLLRQKLSLVSVSQVLTDSYASVVGIKRHLSVPDEKIKLIYLAASTNYKRITDSKLLSTVAKKYGLPKKIYPLCWRYKL